MTELHLRYTAVDASTAVTRSASPMTRSHNKAHMVTVTQTMTTTVICCQGRHDDELALAVPGW